MNIVTVSDIKNIIGINFIILYPYYENVKPAAVGFFFVSCTLMSTWRGIFFKKVHIKQNLVNYSLKRDMKMNMTDLQSLGNSFCKFCL